MSEVADNIEFIETEKLVPAKRNARTHSKRQIEQIVRSIRRFGFTVPLLIDEGNGVVAGHGRLEAAKEMGLSKVPCRKISKLTDAEKRAYMIADNKVALNGGWDMEILAAELGDLIDFDFEIDLTGFDQPEIDQILSDAAEASPVKSGPEDVYPEPPSHGSAVTRPGDLWQLGRHQLLCGDAKDRKAMDLLMDRAQADVVFADPPYNVRIGGNVSGLGKVRHREFAEASGEMSPEEFTDFLAAAFENLERRCRNGAIVYICMDWRHIGELLAAGNRTFSHLMNTCVWAKTNAGMGSFYRSQHELVFVWKVGDAQHTNNFGLGDKGRHRTNLWTYAGVNSFKAGRDEELALHPTVKPVALVMDALRDVSHRGEIVLDPFGGSGTTLIAAEKTGRCARLIELDPIYCDVIIQRWQKITGKQAQLVATGASFESWAAERLADHGGPEQEAAA